MNQINRRTLIKLGAFGLAGGYALSQSNVPAKPTFPEPPVLKTKMLKPGVLEAEVAAAPSQVNIAGRKATLLTYGGSFPGPTLRVREGDRVRLNFINRLTEVTNLHLHGLHVSPTVDDPLAMIDPGQSRLYEFTVPRGSAGTYWYHPHIHKEVAPQLFAGLAGAIVVEGPLDATPGVKEAEEHLLVLKDFALVGSRIAPHNPMDWMNGKEGNLVLVNGALRPMLRAQKSTLRLRLLNASNARYYRLQLEGHPLYLIATDGGFVEKPVELSELLLAPGERAEVLVRLSKEGNFKLQALPYDRGSTGMMGMGGMQNMMSAGPSQLETLLTVVAPSKPRPLPLPASFAPLERLDPAKARVTRRVVFSEDMMASRFFINEKAFDAGRVDFTGRLGDLEVWEIENKGDMDHPFHLHTYPFQVLERNGVAEPFRSWKDVVNLKKDDLVRIAVPLRDFGGLSVYHCHIVEHEDRGMMGTLEVGG
ncbi:MAG: multicopper oxidase family protein [Deinococcus sp.]|nr:multicopper oxidase family protein [Deinococcus sp.]